MALGGSIVMVWSLRLGETSGDLEGYLEGYLLGSGEQVLDFLTSSWTVSSISSTDDAFLIDY